MSTRLVGSSPVVLVGTSSVIRKLQQDIETVAASDAKVLITGESGVGKEIVARTIHNASPRRVHTFVPVNCAGIPETLLESEMFGYARGSFTGAYRDKSGKVELARGGTLFLDEIGEMTLRMQGVFLRFLETGEVQKLGSERVGCVTNVRVIAATNRSLHAEIQEGRFREDLLYRLNVVHIAVPPLRNHPEDIPVLIEHFLRKLADSRGTRVRALSPAALHVLSNCSWPGNVRQLENVMERVMVMSHREVIEPEDLPSEVLGPHMAPVPRREAPGVTADALFNRLINDRESFWTAVYPLYMNREITREHVRDVVHRGLKEARGNYKIVLQMFNMQRGEYKRFLDFLRNHDCKLSFKEYRTSERPHAHE